MVKKENLPFTQVAPGDNTPSTMTKRLSRRSLLQFAGLLIAAVASPRGLAMAAAESVSPVTARLSKYMSEARDHALPEMVLVKVKEHILDTIAAMISGSQLRPGRAAIEFARTYGGSKIATVAASNVLCGPIEAALANGVLAHADETDDSHAPSGSHPGCAIVPAALAVGERFGIGGMHFLRAVTLGYDIGTRVTMSLGLAAFDDAHRDTHSVVGIFGAAAAAGCAATLNAQQMRWLLDYAAQQSSGISALYRDTDHMEKAFVFGGLGARDGVTAALLVQSGWTGIDDILSGPDNFVLAYAPGAQTGGLIEKLGERYEVTRTNIKKWSVGSPIQAPLDALENLRKRRPFEVTEVEKVIVRIATEEESVVSNSAMPDICLQHMMAVMLIDKTVSFQAAHDKPRMQDPAILRQRAKVLFVPDDVLQKRLPEREAIVEITLTDGTHLSEHVDAVRGTAENPMSRDEVVAKCQNLMVPVLGKTTCANLIQKVLDLEIVKDIRELRALLSAPISSTATFQNIQRRYASTGKTGTWSM